MYLSVTQSYTCMKSEHMHKCMSWYHVRIMEIYGHLLCQLYESTTYNKYEQEITNKYMIGGG